MIHFKERVLQVLLGYGLVSKHIYCPPGSLGNKNTSAKFQVSAAV